MKFQFLSFFLIILSGCSESSKTKEVNKDSLISTSKSETGYLSNRSVEMLDDSVSFYRYNVKDTIGEDINCDGFLDLVYFIQKSTVSNIAFFNGKTRQTMIIGQDLPVKDNLGEDYNWVEFWGITKDSSTWEAVINNGEILDPRKSKLLCPSLVLRKDEAGGGIITFKEGGFRWIHQAD